MDMRFTRRQLAALAAGVPLLGQQPGTRAPEKETDDIPVFRDFVRNVVAPTTVVNKQGEYISDLKEFEFRLFDNEKMQKVRADLAWQPLDVVICVQANDTVEPVLEKIQKASNLFEATVLGENGNASVVAFDHRIRLLQDWTNDGALIKKAVEKIRPGSTTSALTDAVVFACRHLKKRPADHRKVILLIAETRDKGSEARTRQALLDLQFGNVVVYSVNINRLITSLLTQKQPARPSAIPPAARHLPPGAAATPENVAAFTGHYSGNVLPLVVEALRQVKSVFIDNHLEAFTKYTGGTERSFLSYKDLERVIQDIGQELHSQYMLSYEPTNKLEGGYHRIVVEVNRPGLTVRTRDGYWMAAIPN